MNTDRQVVTGGSYAGYLTAWIVSQDHRFKAAVAQRGVYDLSTTFFGEGNAWRLVPNHFGGYPLGGWCALASEFSDHVRRSNSNPATHNARRQRSSNWRNPERVTVQESEGAWPAR